METAHPVKLARGQMKCNLCRKACMIKNGDWFVASGDAHQQIFLCKPCESAAKGGYKKVNLNARS